MAILRTGYVTKNTANCKLMISDVMSFVNQNHVNSEHGIAREEVPAKSSSKSPFSEDLCFQKNVLEFSNFQMHGRIGGTR